MGSNIILVGTFENNDTNTRIFLDNKCGCIFSWDRKNKLQSILLHPNYLANQKTDRVGSGISKLGITSLQQITWNKDMFELYGFDFDQLIVIILYGSVIELYILISDIH
jgi:hypothetical protein